MKGPAFLEVELAFGRHAGSWTLGEREPVVVAGPNGAGKTTLIDGILRTIYGFRRRKDDDRRLSAARQPWHGDAFRSAVRLRAPDGDVLSWSRDHETDEVRVAREDGEVLFEGVANPTSKSRSDREYWELVQRVFGLRELDDYARTAWIGQGEMLATEFGDDLLALAEGGHAHLREALASIEERHKELTRESVTPEGRRMNNDRPLEHDRRERDELERKLAEARGAEREHAEAEGRLAEVDEEAACLDERIERLEATRAELAERGRLDAEKEAAEARLDHLIELRDDLEAARRDVREEEAACAAHAAYHDYPDDFPARAERLREGWRQEAKIEREITDAERRLEAARLRPWDLAIPGILGLFAVLAIVFAVTAGPNGPIGLAGAAALVSMGLAALGLWRAAGRRTTCRELEAQLASRQAALEEERRALAGALEGVPDGQTIGPDDLDARLAGFRAARDAARRRDEALRRQRAAIRRVEESAEARGAPGRPLPKLVEDARRRLAEIEVQRRQLGVPTAAIDDGEPAPLTERALDETLQRKRRRRRALRGEREELRIRIDRASRTLAEAAHIERELREIERRIDETERAVEALRAAHALLRDGYDEFREHDEDRLVAAITDRLEALGDPALGPFRAEAGLDSPTVTLGGRPLSIDSPALSHGQRHLVKLAIRLGTADFLSLDDSAAPLVVDEPFAHLDDRHAAQAWELFRRVSEGRQVVIATQEVDLLKKLGIEPHVRLRRAPLSNGGPAVRRAGERAEPAPGAATLHEID